MNTAVGLGTRAEESAILRPDRGKIMQVLGYGLPRMPLLGTWVNKDYGECAFPGSRSRNIILSVRRYARL